MALIAGLVALMLLTVAATGTAGTPSEWVQTGNDAGHSYRNAGPAPHANITYWTSNTGGGIRNVNAVGGGLVVANRDDAIMLLDEHTGALVRSIPVNTPRTVALSGTQVVVAEQSGWVRAFNALTGVQTWAQMTGPITNATLHVGTTH